MLKMVFRDVIEVARKCWPPHAGEVKSAMALSSQTVAAARDAARILLNGRPVEIDGQPTHLTLLDFIRNSGLTGAKEGCAEGECGACAVLLVRDTKHGTAYQPVNSCLVPLPAAIGQEVITVEALAESGELSAVQAAMAAMGGSQCGYCTPGFVVSMFAEHHRRENRPADVEMLGGNLCRCTGYRPIRDALLSLSEPGPGELKARLDRPAPAFTPLTYADGEARFTRPCSLAECLEIAADSDVTFVAGNTDLGVVANLRDQRLPHQVSLEGVPELREFRDGADGIEIGAGLTLTELGERLDGLAIFREWLLLFASPLIRNRATLGGNLATASPIGDSAPLLLALDAAVSIVSRDGERVIPLAEFFTGYRRTRLARGEIIRSIKIPKPLPFVKFYKAAKRRMDDISTVAAGIACETDGAGRIMRMRLAFGGVAAVPLRVRAAEEALEGTFAGEIDRDRAKAALRRALDPISDHRGSAAYRLALAQSLIDKFFIESRAEAA